MKPMALPAHVQRGHLAVAAAGCLALAVVGVVDPSRHALAPPCPLKLLTGLDCPLCGATRATHALLRADVRSAVDRNVLYVASLPVLMAVAAVWVTRGRPPAWTGHAAVPWVVVTLALTFAVLRNIPAAPFTFLHS